MPLVEPLPEPCDDELAAHVPFFEKVLGVMPNSILTMQRRPEIAKAFAALNKAVMAVHTERLTSELKRLISAVASYAAGCRYCQAHTAAAATSFGATEERVANIWDWERSDLYTPAEKAAFAFAQAAACVPNAVDDAIAAALKRHWERRRDRRHPRRRVAVRVPQPLERHDGHHARKRAARARPGRARSGGLARRQARLTPAAGPLRSATSARGGAAAHANETLRPRRDRASRHGGRR